MTNKENRPPAKKKKSLGKLIIGLTIMTAALASAAAQDGDVPCDPPAGEGNPQPGGEIYECD